ncbi:MAG: LuxR family transcriptional regulator [Rhizobiaceae bacterium]|jgi:LuxR family quorum sensing-dependent transcriptional regulator|nr:MAG: LuxR family transcriptional regulator [Rhizobiaceae bacterium]CAG1013045.1 HTH-type quorum sensing-dependent transcriptional regulator RpaR [Rhizobiaceae bacterium]
MNNAVVLELFATISEIDFANSPDRVLQIFRVALETYGLHSFLITGLPVPHDSEWDRAILWDGWPREWFMRYKSEGHFLSDPCAARSRHTAEPFLWHELSADGLTARGRLVMDEAAEFGLKDGLCVPIHLPLAGPAVVTAASDRIEIPPDALPLIETLCVHTFRKLSGLQTKRGEGETAPLTPRERELLQWSAQGKSTEDISCILGVTTNTVESHHRNIRVKLDAINVAHAIVKALRRQEIQI